LARGRAGWCSGGHGWGRHRSDAHDRSGFPWHTFAANLIGSVAIGLIWAVLTRAEAALLWSAFLITGVLGGWLYYLFNILVGYGAAF